MVLQNILSEGMFIQGGMSNLDSRVRGWKCEIPSFPNPLDSQFGPKKDSQLVCSDILNPVSRKCEQFFSLVFGRNSKLNYPV